MEVSDDGYMLMQTIFIPIVFSIIILAVGKRLKEKTGWLTAIPLIYISLLLCYININIPFWNILIARYRWSEIFGDFILIADGLSSPIALTIALLGTVISIYSIYYMKHEERLELYFALYLLYISGMIGTVLSMNLVAFFIFFEFMLLPSWVLIGIWGTGRKELIAFKYFMFTEIGALSSLIGIATLYSFTGTLNILEIGKLSTNIDISILLPTAIALLLGFFIKMAIVPLHTWLPDAHAEAPTPISALLSPAMIGIGGYASIRIIYTAIPKLTYLWEFMTGLSILALITMIYGGLMAIAQDDIKRLLAYSSISQMGYMLFGISSMSSIGISGSALLYVSHGLAKAVLFMVAGILMHEFHTRKISELRGLARVFPLTTTTALIGFLSLSGVPPFLGFWSEIFIFAGSMYTAIHDGLDIVKMIITSLAIILSVFTAGYGLWTIKRLFYGEPSEKVLKVKGEPLIAVIPLLILSLFTVILGIYPTPLIVNFMNALYKLFS